MDTLDTPKTHAGVWGRNLTTLASFLERRFLERPWVAPAILALAGAASFWGALSSDFTTWDDNVYITENRSLGDLSPAGILGVFTSFQHSNYHPLTSLTYRVEYALVGLNPWLYHLDNVIVHLGSAILAFHLARRWLGSEAMALLASLLFLLHPLRVESVAWVGERKDVLCTFFYLGALLAYPGRESARPGRSLALSLALFVMALLSKVMAVTLPAVLLVLLAWERRLDRAELRRLAPFLALAAAFALVGIAAQASGGAVQGLRGDGFGSHLLTIPAALAFYAGKLVLPVLLSPRYVVEPVRGVLDPRVLCGLALVALAIWAAVRSHRSSPAVFLGISLFAIAWAPVSGIIASSTPVADRYLYLPSVGLFVALAAGIQAGLSSELTWRRSLSRIGSALALSFLAWCLYLTPARVAMWKDGITLWTDALRENPRNCLAHSQLATAHYLAGRYAEAAAAATEAVRFGLTDPPFLYNLCVAYRAAGDSERELATAREILRIEPQSTPAWSVILRHERLAGRLDECSRMLDDLEARYPGDAALLFARGELEEAHGNLDSARSLLLRSVEGNPEDLEVRLAAAVVLEAVGDPRRAVEAAERTVRLARSALHPEALRRLRQLVDAVSARGPPELAARAQALARLAGA